MKGLILWAGLPALLAGVMLLTLASVASASEGDSWTGADKAKHAALSTAGAAAVTIATGSRGWGFGACAAAGAVKEAWDARTPGHTPSLRDFGADLAGCALGAYLGGVVITPRSITYRLEF